MQRESKSSPASYQIPLILKIRIIRLLIVDISCFELICRNITTFHSNMRYLMNSSFNLNSIGRNKFFCHQNSYKVMSLNKLFLNNIPLLPSLWVCWFKIDKMIQLFVTQYLEWSQYLYSTSIIYTRRESSYWSTRYHRVSFGDSSGYFRFSWTMKFDKPIFGAGRFHIGIDIREKTYEQT